MRSFLDRLESGADECGVRGTRVLVGVSGGADSVALLRGLWEIRVRRQLDVVAAHLNHRLRGEPSDRDADWVADLCSQLGVPLVLDSRDVAGIVQRQGGGLEEAARRVRYEFLTEAAVREGCSHVAVAHTADDQAETILHHVLRGTGISGLSGMSPLRPLESGVQLARPLLDVTRADVETYLRGIGQDFRTDESNAEPAFTRNRIRHALLPLLRREFNPQIEQSLLRLGRQAADVQAALEELAGRLLDAALIDQNETTCRLDCARLAGEPAHLVRECCLLLWKRQAWPRRRMGFEDWNRLAGLVRADVSEAGGATLPGNIEAKRRGGLLVLRRMGE